MAQRHQLEARELPPAAAEAVGSRPVMHGRRAPLTWYAFVGLSVAFALCVALQVFIAGLAIFVTPAYWPRHLAFVHIFEFLPLLMLVLSAVGRMPARLRWLSAALCALVYVQYFTANIRGIVPLLAALHPVVALIIFWLSLSVVRQARQALAELPGRVS